MKYVRFNPYRDDSPYPKWVSACKGARTASFQMGAERRDKIASYVFGLLSGVATTLLATWLTGLLHIGG